MYGCMLSKIILCNGDGARQQCGSWACACGTPLLAWLAVLLVVPFAAAQHDVPRQDTWVTDGPVRAIERTADTTYIGGNFRRVGPYTGAFRDGVAAVSTETGFATPWQPPSGVATTFALHPSLPSLVMGGSFSRHFAEFSLIPGDLNGDGQVNLDDLLLLLDGWDTDHVLDDLLDLLDNWGEGL